MESGNFADIPLPGSSVLPDEPLVSVIETGKSREEVLGKLRIACGKVRDAGKTDR
jgi:predicted ATP-grasp superfamily ATP-dependent carboligase